MITAGHCFYGMDSLAPVYHRTVLVGHRSNWSYGGTRDFGLIRMTSPSRTGPYVWYTSAPPVAVRVQGTNTDYGTGDVRCHTGKQQGTRCGTITQSSWSGYYSDGVYMSDVYRTNASCINGDSGGPSWQYIFSRSYAAGIVSLGGPSCGFVKWTNIPSSWGISVST